MSSKEETKSKPPPNIGKKPAEKPKATASSTAKPAASSTKGPSGPQI